MKRHKLIIAGMAVTFLPTAFTVGIVALALLNMVNPMQVTFISEFEVQNDTDQPFWITPTGTTRRGSKDVLPQFMSKFPAVFAFRETDIEVFPGDRARIHYDWDDINFSEILVRDSKGRLCQLVVDPSPPTDAYYRNRQALFEIKDTDALPQASDKCLSAVQNHRRNQPRFWLFVLGGLACTVVFFRLRRQFRRINEVEAENSDSTGEELIP